ncbi:putative bifunctional diguanylate cyclase/phosphodiesterase [Paracandidimonas soli]|uniref:Diguanylate cyclase/phosphodiesterase n=1 Tax=Paracandidimonas soli TaxID=1917182 RepID=A0A4R3VBR9_9BURK|nr:EAL domain-containing protein [Paracandidimonas soli]TCV02726.1 diguanylate cyclase/phosphodiesterase [Paracandidimonas soli]
MGLLDVLRSNGRKNDASALDRLIYVFAIYAVPLVIVLFSLVALLSFNSIYDTKQGSPLAFRLATDPLKTQTPGQALDLLGASGANVLSFPLEKALPYWMIVNVPPREHDSRIAVEVPSRQVRSLQCWDADHLTLIGSANRNVVDGMVRHAKAGFIFQLDSSTLTTRVLCEVTAQRNMQLTASLWPMEDMIRSINQFHRITGLLEGGLLTVAAFILIIAFINREWVYVLFAAWMIGNLRLGAMAMGWDDQWLGNSIPQEWLPRLRQITVAIHFLLTYTLFTRIFHRSLLPLLQSRALLLVQGTGLLLLLAALVLSEQAFLPVMWAATSLGIVTIALLLGHSIYMTHSRVETLHVVSLSMALCVMLSGVMLFAFGGSRFIDTLNAVITLLLSNLMVAVAIAERLRRESRDKEHAQSELIGNFAVTPIGMFTLDASRHITRANPVFERILGLSLADQASSPLWTDLLPDVDWEELDQKTRRGDGVEIRWPDELSDNHKTLLVKAAIVDEKIEGSIQDISSHTATIQHLRQLADNDPLTDALNRRGIEKALDASLQALTKGQPCALAYLDLDHFKRVNSLFGHTTGDEVLKQVCQRVMQAISEQDQMGRLSDNEFIVLFPNTTIGDARVGAQRIIDALHAAPFQIGPRSIQVKGTVGVIEVTESMQAKDAISAASRACRDAQKIHQDIISYDHNANELLEHSEELRLFSELEGGLSPKGLYLEMQPIVSLRNPFGAMDFEALLRVRDSAGKLIPTGKIIASAEESGTISIIDKWVFSATLEWLDKHRGQLSQTSFVCINMSGVSLNDQRFIEAFFDILAQYEHLTHLVCVEITEGVALHDLEKTRVFMHRLQQKGVRIALDDFGAGYSSFSYLASLPADAIKIDGALIRGMTNNPANVAVVRTIIELARNLGMKSIVEWVEDNATLSMLWDMEVDYVQGYGVVRPQPPSNLLKASTMADLIANPDTLTLMQERIKRRP